MDTDRTTPESAPVSVPSTSLQLGIHNTPALIWEQLSRVFGVESYDASQWITFTKDDATVTFFAPTATATEAS